jgi:cytochrome P450
VQKEQILIPAIREVVKRPRLAAALFRFDRWGNPFSAETHRDPYPQMELCRRDGRVVHRALYQQWFVFGYDEARQVLASEHVSVRGQIDTLLKTSPYPKLSDRARQFFVGFLLINDPPDHTRLRRLVNRAFTPARVRDLEPRVRGIADDLVAPLADRGTVDVVEGFCMQLPSHVISEMLGIPEERWAWVRDVTRRIVLLIDPMIGFDPDEVSDAVDEIWEVVGAIADERRDDPRDDLITALVEAEEDGDRLTRDELITMVGFLMGAGYETTSGLLGNAIVHVAANPDQRRLLAENPGLWPNATEELIRYDSGLRMAARMTSADLAIGDVTIPAGSNIIVNLLAANRDPAKYTDPDELHLDRANPDPLSFGYGIHHCLGAALARLELRVGLQAFLDAFGDYEVDPDRVTWRPSATLRGPIEIPVRPGARSR